jgi:carbon-monoxide dehydrogenase large subunit
VLGGGAVLKAADALAARLRRIAAKSLEADWEDIVLSDGACHVKGVPEHGIAIRELAEIAYLHGGRRPEGMEAGLSELASYRTGRAITFPFGAHVAEVEVDPDTGIARVVRYTAGEDCGPALNPALVEGQIRGGVAQGIGSVLLEHLAFDAKGQPLSTTLFDYLMPGPEDVPEIEVVSTVTPSPDTPLGMKGVGEAALIAAPAAVAAALEDALSHRVSRLPMAVSDVWACRPVASGVRS